MSRHIIKVRNNKTKDTKRQRQDGGEIMSKEESKLSVHVYVQYVKRGVIFIHVFI